MSFTDLLLISSILPAASPFQQGETLMPGGTITIEFYPHVLATLGLDRLAKARIDHFLRASPHKTTWSVIPGREGFAPCYRLDTVDSDSALKVDSMLFEDMDIYDSSYSSNWIRSEDWAFSFTGPSLEHAGPTWPINSILNGQQLAPFVRMVRETPLFKLRVKSNGNMLKASFWALRRTGVRPEREFDGLDVFLVYGGSKDRYLRFQFLDDRLIRSEELPDMPRFKPVTRKPHRWRGSIPDSLGQIVAGRQQKEPRSQMRSGP